MIADLMTTSKQLGFGFSLVFFYVAWTTSIAILLRLRPHALRALSAHIISATKYT